MIQGRDESRRTVAMSPMNKVAYGKKSRTRLQYPCLLQAYEKFEKQILQKNDKK